MPYGFVTLHIECSSFLLNGAVIEVNVQPVSYHLWVNAKHVLMRPGEDIIVFLQEGLRVLLGAFREHDPYFSGPGRISLVHLNWN